MRCSLKCPLAMLAAKLLITTAGADEVCWTSGATQFAAATHYCVSSVLRPQSGNTYGPNNLADNDPRTAWCEGAKGNGIGEIITIRIDEGPPFRRLMISNGYGKSASVYKNNGRVRTVSITTDTGLQTAVNLIDQNGALPVYLPGMAQHWVRVTILDIYPGASFTDTCLDSISPDFIYEERLLQQQQEQPEQQPRLGQGQQMRPEQPPQQPLPLGPDKMPELEELPPLPGADSQ